MRAKASAPVPLRLASGGHCVICRAVWLFTLAAALPLLVPARSTAQFEPAGDVTGAVAVTDRGLGGGVGADIYAPLGAFRLGGYLGVAGIVGNQEEESLFLVPVAVAAGWLLQVDTAVWIDVRARVGVWTGAFSEGFGGGFWASPGLYVEVPLASGVALGVGAEGWFALGSRDLFGVAPGVTLAWLPPSE